VSAQKGLELDSESPEAHNLVGYIRAAEGQSEEALDHYRKAIELDDTYVEAMLNAAEVLLPMGDLDGAIALIEDALELIDDDTELADAMLLKVDILMQKGDIEEARRVVRLLPSGPYDNPALDFFVARAQFEVDDLDSAGPRIERAATGDPDNSEAQYYLGLLRERQSQRREATVAFLRTRELDLRGEPPPWTLPADQFEKRVQAAIAQLPPEVERLLDGALVVVGDVPGAEVVAEGVDPRLGVLLDAPEPNGEATEKRIVHVFVYQRNIERSASGVFAIEEEVSGALLRELAGLFPDLVVGPDVPTDTIEQ
jgi:tetratricopeptide (TPR) repeat protein